MVAGTLSSADVARLLSDPSPEARVETAAKLARSFVDRRMTEAERKIAADIFRLMVRDAEVRVREALSNLLKESAAVPHDVAMSLARDVERVALPVLQFSEVLTEGDLLEIVRDSSPAKQVAVAKRPHVSERVSDALVDTRNEEVVATLVANDGADISEASFQKVIEEFPDNEAVQAPLVNRSKLPVAIVEQLVVKVSDSLRETLAARHAVSPDVVADLILNGRERATLSLSSGASDEELLGLVEQLRRYGRLTPSIVLRAMCTGDVAFLEASLAALSKVPLANARMLLHDEGPLGLKAIWGKAHLPATLLPAARCAIDVARETSYDGGERDRERYVRRTIERILTRYDGLGVEFDSGDLEYLIAKMNQLPADQLPH